LAASEIIFIRHGQASFGSDDYDRLSPTGVRQSQVTADHLVSHGIDFDAVVCGRMKRQADTALPLCRHYGASRPDCASPTVMEAFNEYSSEAIVTARLQADPKSWPLAEGHRPASPADKKAFQAFFSETVNQWLAGVFDDHPAVEPWPAFCRRVTEGVGQLIARHGRGKRLAVFTSGGPIMVVVREALGLSGPKTVEIGWQIMNASLTSIRYTDDRLILTAFNTTTHLLIEKDPALLTYR